MSAGINIKHALIERQIKQKELAEMLGTSCGNISKMLNNDKIGYNKAEEIAEILGYEIIWRKKEEYHNNVNQTVNNNGTISNTGNGFVGIQNNIKE